MSLGFLASYLEKHGIRVSIIDELAGQNVKRQLQLFSPDIVGITATTPVAADAYRIAAVAKKMGMVTVMGGVHASILPEEARGHVDVVVVGEGEDALLDIVKNNIRSGIVSRTYLKDLDDIPLPARHLMQMDYYVRTKDRFPQTYLYFVPARTKVAALLTSRGCPYDCIFCHNTWKNMPYRFSSPARVIEEIEGLIRDYGVQALFFIEDNFFVHKHRVARICEEMVKKKFNVIWGANARVDNIDEDILLKAKQAGCRQVTFGFESGSQKILDILQKKTTVTQNVRAIELCNKVGIVPQGTVMIGNPHETLEDIRETQRFISNAAIESIGVCITTPYPGTALWEWCRKTHGISGKIDWARFDYDRVVIPVSNTMSAARIKQLQLETIALIAHKRHIGFWGLVRAAVLHPFAAVRIMMHPSYVAVIIKRIFGRSRG